MHRRGGGAGFGRSRHEDPPKTAPGAVPRGCSSFLRQAPKGRRDRAYIPTFSLYQEVVWDFGRVMGSHQARLMMSWERRPMARETLKKTV